MPSDRQSRIPRDSDFTRGLGAARSLATDYGLPRNPHKRRRRMEEFRDSYSNLSPNQRWEKLSKDLIKGGPYFGRKEANVQMGVGDTYRGGFYGGPGGMRSVMPKHCDPIMSPLNRDIPYWDDANTREMAELRRLCRMWCRMF